MVNFSEFLIIIIAKSENLANISKSVNIDVNFNKNTGKLNFPVR